MSIHRAAATRHFSSLLALAAGVLQSCCAAPGPCRRLAVWQSVKSQVVVLVDCSSSTGCEELKSRLDTVLGHCVRDCRPVVAICTARATELPSAEVYSSLMWLEGAGWLASPLEDIETHPARVMIGSRRSSPEVPAGPRTIDSATDPAYCVALDNMGLQSRRPSPRCRPGFRSGLDMPVPGGPCRPGHVRSDTDVGHRVCLAGGRAGVRTRVLPATDPGCRDAPDRPRGRPQPDRPRHRERPMAGLRDLSVLAWPIKHS